jgi:glycosyltransferase involved in cell wall biosynthesis
MSRLLMVSGDTAIARGEQGPFYNTLAEFAKYWDGIEVLTPYTGIFEPVSPFENVTVYSAPRKNKLGLPGFIIEKGQALVKQNPYDLIVSHDYGLFLNGRGAARLAEAIGKPYVSEIHHVEGYPRAANLREWIEAELTRQYVVWAKDKARAFRIVNDGEMKPLLLRWGVPEAKILLLYSLYLDLEVFRPATLSPEYDAMFCGRLTANKAPELFLESVAEAQKQTGTLRALVVGRGPLGPKLQARAKQLKLQVDFVEWVAAPSDLADLYRRSQCLVCTSYSEGGPRVVAEALACGTPVVTTRVGLARELVRDGENGFQADWSAVEVGARIAQIVRDPSLRSKLSLAAPERVQGFEKSKVIRDYALGYQRLIA